MPDTDITRGELFSELTAIQVDLGDVQPIPQIYEKVSALLRRVEAACSNPDEEWFRLTPFMSQVMSAYSHLSNAQELCGDDSPEFDIINNAKGFLNEVIILNHPSTKADKEGGS